MRDTYLSDEIIESQDPHLVQIAVDLGCDLNSPNSNGLMPLANAVQLNDIPLVRALLKAGACPNQRNEDGSTALTWGQSAEICGLLADFGASVNSEQPEGGSTSVHEAAGLERLVVLKVLIERCDGQFALRRQDLLGHTPLHKAAQAGHKEIVSYLCARGADINFTGDEAWRCSPLQLAAEFRQYSIFALLLKLGADPDLETETTDSARVLARRDGIYL